MPPRRHLCVRQYFPTHIHSIALLEQVPDAEKARLIIKARRLTTASTTHNAVALSCLQGRAAHEQLLSQVVMAPLVEGLNDEDEEGGRKLHILLAFLVGIGGGPKDEGMPQDVFRVVLDLIMPAWDPLRRGVAGAGPAVRG